MDRKFHASIRGAVLAAASIVCLLAYLHRIPIAYGMAACLVFPLTWAADAYRSEKRLPFAVAAALVLVIALPLLHLLR